MFGEEEMGAVVRGWRGGARRTDGPLAWAARNALAKIAAVLPDELRHGLDTSALLVGPASAQERVDLSEIRRAIRAEHKLDIVYRNGDGAASHRLIWPFGLGFFEQSRVVLGWCELRQDFRHFRTDRIQAMTATDQRYPRRRQALLKAWREKEGIPPQEV